MKKLNVVAIIIAIVAIGAAIGIWYYFSKEQKKVDQQYQQEISDLQTQLSAYGEKVSVWTVSRAVKAGDLVEYADLVETTAASSMVSDQFISDASTIVGKFYKIAINPNTPLMTNMFMEEELEDTMRDRDIVLDRLTVGLEAGDYIDIRMTMPYGDDYVVLTHKRIYDINESTIKLHLTELEWFTYQGALIDYYLNFQYGCTIYGDKYIEPGLQQEARAYYAVPRNIAALLQKNPNIVDKEAAANLNEWRTSIEELLVLFRTDDDTVESDAGKLSAGRSALNEAVESDRETAKTEADQQAAEQAEQEQNETIQDEFDWSDTPTQDAVVDEASATLEGVE